MIRSLWLLGIAVVSVATADSDTTAVQKALSKLVPGGISEDSISPSAVNGVYEVSWGTKVFYVTQDGKYVFTGDLIYLQTQENLGERKRNTVRKALLDAVDEKSMIIFEPSAVKRMVSVFTDVDCPYCAKFHLDVPKLVASGVRVRYLSFPRTGTGSESYRRAVSVWCADDPRKAMGVAKAGGRLEPKNCPNSVAQHYELGIHLGVGGTPTIFLDDGSMIPGYVPPDKLLQALALPAPASALAK